MSADELGRLVFMAARGGDLPRYRGLFLSGSEAAEVLGADAASYLEQRSYAVLQESLTELSGQLSPGTIYGGLGEQRGRMFAIKIKDSSGERTLRIGTVVQLGRVWRLLEPAVAR